MLNRRHFIVSATAMAAASPALATGLDPTDKDISFGLYLQGVPAPYRTVTFKIKDIMVDGKLEM